MSDQTSFPIADGPDLSYNSGTDAFVAKVKADGSALVYAGYIGGNAFDAGQGIAVDDSGRAYVVGRTFSNESSFPIRTGPDLSLSAPQPGTPTPPDAFVARVGAGFDPMEVRVAVTPAGPNTLQLSVTRIGQSPIRELQFRSMSGPGLRLRR